jgi:hypothetical protein
MLRTALRKFEMGVGLMEVQYRRVVEPFLEKFSKLSEKDDADLDLALKNNDLKTVEEVVSRAGMKAEYEALVKMLDGMYERAKAAKLDIGHRAGYYPRGVLDYDGLNSYIEALSDVEVKGTISKLIKGAEKARGAPFTPEERAEYIDRLLQKDSDVYMQIPSNVRSRVITKLDGALNDYYKHSTQALIDYVRHMNEAIAAREFFGENPAKLDTSIGHYVKELIEDGVIRPQDEKEVRAILKARFDTKNMSAFLQGYRNFSIVTTMGSYINTLTQINDLSWSLY